MHACAYLLSVLSQQSRPRFWQACKFQVVSCMHSFFSTVKLPE